MEGTRVGVSGSEEGRHSVPSDPPWSLPLAFLALALTAFALASGCGGKYDSPLETEKTPRTSEYTYWDDYVGFGGATRLAVRGGRLFVAFEDAGKVEAYDGTGDPIPGIEFRGLQRPKMIGTGPRSIAIADSSGSLEVKIYKLSGGDPLVAFTDPDWREVSGLAIDDSGYIYVADAARNFVRSYRPNGRPRFGIDHADSGFGIGHVLGPRCLYFEGEALLIAEGGLEKNQVQKVSVAKPQRGIPFSDEVPLISSFIDKDQNEITLMWPGSVASDAEGGVLVLDRTYKTIFRYDAQGRSSAIVNLENADPKENLIKPVALGTYLNRVYVLDTATGTIHRWDKEI